MVPEGSLQDSTTGCILSQRYPVHTLPSYSSKIRSDQNFVCISNPDHVQEQQQL
jgi:hypothetical protein